MNVSPRWRTMIEPAGTSWPSPTFTPRRWPTESRPFFELEPAFLWAIDQSSFFAARARLAAGFAVSGAGVSALALRFGASAAGVSTFALRARTGFFAGFFAASVG